MPLVFVLMVCSSAKGYDTNTASPPEEVANGNATRALDYIFSQLETMIKPGFRTEQLEECVARHLPKVRARGYFKGYGNYPNFISASINDQVVHTPPSKRSLKKGDLLKIEFGLEKNSEYAFLGWTYPVGDVSPENKRLLECGKNALKAGIDKALPNVPVADVSRVIDTTIRRAGFKPNRDYVGYKMGERPVMSPQIPIEFDPARPPVGKLRSGDTISVLVIVHAGDPDVLVSSDGWTVFSSNHRPSVLFSKMIRLGETNAQQLTQDRK
jgi:methionyl aminopeptidase